MQVWVPISQVEVLTAISSLAGPQFKNYGTEFLKTWKINGKIDYICRDVDGSHEI
jgi:hypothetical protein